MSCLRSLRTLTRFQLIINLQRRLFAKSSNVIGSNFSDVEIPNVTIPEYVFENFSRYPDKIAVECAATERKYTFEQIRTKSRNLSRALRKICQLKNGDVIAISLPNIPEFPICVLGCLEAGITVTTINPSHTAGEIKIQLQQSGTKTVITSSGLYRLASTATKGLGKQIPIISIKEQESEALPEDVINFYELINTDFEAEKVAPANANNTALILYSSGTTGLPKAVKLSHINIIANLSQMSHPLLNRITETTATHQDVTPGTIPWFHSGGFSAQMLFHLRHQSKLLPLPKFSSQLFIATLSKHKPQSLFITPTIVLFMSNSSAVKKEHLSSVRSILCGSAPLGPLDEEKLLNKAGGQCSIVQCYGLTETSPLILSTSPIRKKEIGFKGSAGEPLPNTLVKVVSADDPNKALGLNEPGELLVKGPQVTVGYLNNVEATKNAFIDGWLRTGDLVYYEL